VSFSHYIQTFSDVFNHVQTCLYDSFIITMKTPWLLRMTHHHVMVIIFTKHVQTCLYMSVNLPTHDSSAFSIYSPLSSASITPSLQPTSQLYPLSRFCHNTTFTSTYNHLSNFLHFQPVDVPFSQLSDWTYQLLTLHS